PHADRRSQELLDVHEHARGQRACGRDRSGARLRGRPRPPRGFCLVRSSPMLPRRVPYSPVVVPGLAVACLMAPWLSWRLAAQTMGIRQVSAPAEDGSPLETLL